MQTGLPFFFVFVIIGNYYLPSSALTFPTIFLNKRTVIKHALKDSWFLFIETAKLWYMIYYFFFWIFLMSDDSYRWVKWENSLRYFSGKERSQKDCLIGKKRKKCTWVKSFLMFYSTLSGSLISVALIWGKLHCAKLNLMLSSTRPQRNTPESDWWSMYWSFKSVLKHPQFNIICYNVYFLYYFWFVHLYFTHR